MLTSGRCISNVTYCALKFWRSCSSQSKPSLSTGPGLEYFLSNSQTLPIPSVNYQQANVPYLDSNQLTGKTRKDVHGCQMNVNDTEIALSVLTNAGFEQTTKIKDADVILMMTCAIREGAETKIWNKLEHYKAMKRNRLASRHPLKIGILGCMAERLKTKLIEKENCIDLVAGPDSYKDLPRLLALTDRNQTAINVILSQDETYADVVPVRLNQDSVTAFVSIMRGCDNMCTYCIVPFTRGRERSRPLQSIVEEVKHLSNLGVKEVTLLGQNVNSYRDLSSDPEKAIETNLAKGFKTVYKQKKGGTRFAQLLEAVASVDPAMRVRFTSPHPKDFPDEVLEVIKQRDNVCCNIHLPAQSGNSEVLERMRRGYTREVYLELVDRIRSFLPNVTLSSDFICGFCGETEQQFQDTIDLIEKVGYHVAYLFAYSMREKTTAHRRYQDDVPAEVKQERLIRMVDAYRKSATELNKKFVGTVQTVLIEGKSKRSESSLQGRNDGNIKVIIPQLSIPHAVSSPESRNIAPGDYVAVMIEESNSQVLKGKPLYHTHSP